MKKKFSMPIKIKCEGCEIILGGLCNPSKENPLRCEACLHLEDNITNRCKICEVTIIDLNPVKYYKQHGNFCFECLSGINQGVKNRIKHKF